MEVNLASKLKEQHSQELVELQQKVDTAFQNRVFETMGDNGDSDERLAETHKAYQTLSSLPDEEVVNSVYNAKPNEVTVSNSHDYFALLKMASKKVLPPMFNKYEEDTKNWLYQHIESMSQTGMESIAEHEYKHAVPILGMDDIQIHYGIAFLEGKNGGDAQMRSFVSVTGSLTVGIYKEILSAVDDPSPTDKIMLGIQ